MNELLDQLIEFWRFFITEALELLPQTDTLMGGTFLALAAAVVLVPVMSRIKLGTMLGYLAAGILVGPYGLGAVREVESIIKAEGERAILETNIHNIHPELIRLLGRMHYRTSYGQNVLNHCIEVSHIAGLLAAEIGADVNQAKRAGLLHDIGKSVDHEIEGSHVQIGVDLARRYKENEQIVHAIAAHHNDVEPQTVVACLVQAADAISAARPGARRENVENYIKRLERLEEISSSFKGVDKAYAIQAGREIRIMVKPEIISEDQMVILARDIAKQIEETMEYPGQIKVNLIRETKAIDYAK